ncbi:hypothetical protein [Acidovorax sp. ST3]|uniref:hypothetical protein n=1 Tax=Acidovorax sp. ST3 TaxID=2219062 RepID=UPI00129002C7|nr:hypothetical protein [Acidovorax sp. ST3]
MHRRKLTELSKESKLLSRRISSFLKSSFGRWLLQTIRTHGTVQILQGLKEEDLSALLRLKTTASRFNGFEKGKPTREYHLSHIFSARGNQRNIGLLHPTNLVIAPAKYNLSRRNCEEAVDGRGRSICKNILKPHFSCNELSPATDIIHKLKRLLKKDFDNFLLKNTFKPGIHAKLINEVRKHKENIEEVTTIERLQEIKAELGLRLHMPQGKPAPIVVVLAEELERHNLVNTPIYWVIYQIASRIHGATHIAKLKSSTTDADLQRLFLHALDVLHQKRTPSYSGEIYALDFFDLPQEHSLGRGYSTVLSPVDLYFERRIAYSTDSIASYTTRKPELRDVMNNGIYLTIEIPTNIASNTSFNKLNQLQTSA